MKIQAPKGYEIDTEKSTFECIKFRPIKKEEKKLSYYDVAEALFKDKTYYFIDENGRAQEYDNPTPTELRQLNIFSSPDQGRKLMGMNMLMNVATYLNKKQKRTNSERFFIYFDFNQNELRVAKTNRTVSINVYFNSKELAEQAISILGKDLLTFIFCVAW